MSRSSAATSALCIFFLVASSLAEKAPYDSFVRDATLAPAVVYYDYIVIGGGTAGCSLAATLSRAANVLILERGGLPYSSLAMTRSGTTLNLLDISPTSTAQLFLTTDGVYSHRSRVLGGSSAINFGFYSRATDEQVRENGWDPQLVIESYQWVESKLVIESPVGEWQDAIRGGLLEAGVVPDRGFTYEHLNGTKVGGTIFDRNGNRHSAADLLEYANSTNIGVFLHATVHQVLFETIQGRPKAYGVSFADSLGNLHNAYLNKKLGNEIIISAGAIGSPQLLMLSGVGPAQELEAHGINVILDHPLVGQGMSDNPLNLLIVPSPKPVELSIVGIVGITNSGNYIEAASGFIDNQTFAWFHQILVQGGLNLNLNTQLGVIGQKFATTYSTGSLKLKTKDPNDTPRVTFNYYQDQRDQLKCVEGMKIIKKVLESSSFAKFQYPLISFQALKNIMLLTPLNLRRKHLSSTFSMEQFCIDTVMSFYHYHGGCQLNKVVDQDYKVIGVDSLRVIDGSTFLNSPGTNPQATVMMLGRYMGQKILQEQGIH